MGTTDTLDFVRDFNLAYLSLVQSLLREDRTAGMARFCMTPEVADILIGLSAAQLAKLAVAPHVLCHFRFNAQPTLAALSDSLHPAGAALAPGSSVCPTTAPLPL